ncbi:hypothetical protein G3T14_03915 [Methylobacterium sp. BTF04]|uniref:hypothetical protein n=1 Tax=Methylobacterium sp. BTF04 TaxID=2708300 RepID=UPI0013D692C7|nr:hypothetical protein [Methylobacterium sp. BTF04]NEU11272.1 hypothetical protein [Methylobacterium sp. BTF04]
MIIEIPGEITFTRTYAIPPVQVRLPLQAHARTVWLGAITAIGVCFTVPFLALWLVSVATLGRGILERPVGSLVFLTMLSFSLITLLPQTLFGIADLLRRGPALVLEAQGFTDRRAGLTLPWSAVAAARIVHDKHGPRAHLDLKTAVPPPRALFVRGGDGWLGRRRPDTYVLNLGLLSVRGHVLSETVSALVRLNGDTVK